MRVQLNGWMHNEGQTASASFRTIKAHYRVDYYSFDRQIGHKYTRNLNRALALGIAWVTSEQNRKDASPSS